MSGDYEEQAVPVHPSQSKRAMHNLSAAGVPILGGGMGAGGQYIIIVAVPVGGAAPDWRSAPPRPRSAFRPVISFDWRMFVQIVCVLAIVGGVAYFAWGMAGGESGDGLKWDGIAWDDVGAWLDARAAALRPLPRGEPIVETTEWRWPWESRIVNAPKGMDIGGGWSWLPANPIGNAIDGAATAVTWLVWALLAVVALWLGSQVFSIVRRFRG